MDRLVQPRRLLKPIGNIPPAEDEDQYYAMLDEAAMAAHFNEMASGKPGAVHLLRGKVHGAPRTSLLRNSHIDVALAFAIVRLSPSSTQVALLTIGNWIRETGNRPLLQAPRDHDASRRSAVSGNSDRGSEKVCPNLALFC